MILPFVSMLNSWLLYSQSFTDSFIVTLGEFVWILYFILQKSRLTEADTLRVFLYVSLFIAAIQIIQQFTYPNILFGVMNEPDEFGELTIEQRNGLYRFRVSRHGYYTVPVLFAMWTWLQKKQNKSFILLTIILLVSIYLSLTRQVMVACIFAIFLSFFIGNKSTRKGARSIILGLILLVVLYYLYDILFSSLAEQTQGDLDEDYIRFASAKYFWEESIKNPLVFLFGHGEAAADSAYGVEMSFMQEVFGFYYNDVGFIGQLFINGVIYVIICYRLMYKIFFKYKNVVPTYTRLFVAFVGIMSIMIFPMVGPAQYVVWCMVLYICDLHINERKAGTLAISR